MHYNILAVCRHILILLSTSPTHSSMFAAKARQVGERTHADRSDSIEVTVGRWEAAELEKVEAKAKLLG